MVLSLTVSVSRIHSRAHLHGPEPRGKPRIPSQDRLNQQSVIALEAIAAKCLASGSLMHTLEDQTARPHSTQSRRSCQEAMHFDFEINCFTIKEQTNCVWVFFGSLISRRKRSCVPRQNRKRKMIMIIKRRRYKVETKRRSVHSRAAPRYAR